MGYPSNSLEGVWDAISTRHRALVESGNHLGQSLSTQCGGVWLRIDFEEGQLAQTLVCFELVPAHNLQDCQRSVEQFLQWRTTIHNHLTEGVQMQLYALQ